MDIYQDIVHYGTPRHSGRYPWGSGHDPQQNHKDFIGYVNDLKKKGVSEPDIAKGLGLETTTQLRAKLSIATNAARAADATQALRLKDKGMGNSAIARQMGVNESTVRSLLDPAISERQDVLTNTANMLKEKVGTSNYLDVGAGTENQLGISANKLATAVAVLKEQGYAVHSVQVSQLGTANKTTVKVLAPPGTKYVDIVRNMDNIKPVQSYTEDGGQTFTHIEPPKPISSSRVGVRYAEDGGASADGVIYVRRGVPDVALGSARYAQVRVAVDGTHYLKGMAVYRDDMPPGKDLVFNTNKSSTGNHLDAMKSIKDDPERPFGSVTRQLHYTDAAGKKQLSVMNIVNEEGNWNDWSRTLSSQFLSKQPQGLAREQLDMAYQNRKDELDGILKLTNPVVKKKLLSTFADGADSAAVHLKAAALPRQRTQVILPFSSLKENEIYAPNFNNGERVVLVRHPHGGPFEIPELTVNNRNREAAAALGSKPGSGKVAALDAVGIHPKVAERLSGADFDGDTVLVIPNNSSKVKTQSPLKGLEGFDPKTAYAPYDGMKTIDGGTYHAATKTVDYGGKKPNSRPKQQQMGDVSNLITDMSIRGASPTELAAAVRHSMVVIDAEKHMLNVKQSYIDNGIASLKEKYQGRGSSGRLSGASTIVSRSGNAKTKIPVRKLRSAAAGGPIDRTTGKRVFVETGETYVDKKTGKVKSRLMDAAPLDLTDDARTLLGKNPTPMEEIYANHSNQLKALANQARKSSLTAGTLVHNPSASRTYAREVASLNSSLNTALKNKPRERQAQLIANAMVSAAVHDNPGMEAADLKKIKGQYLAIARARVGAKKEQITISPREWEAIQAGAITPSKLSQILDNSNLDEVKALATPREGHVMNAVKLSRAKSMLQSGYTQAEIASALGVPVSTVNSALKSGR